MTSCIGEDLESDVSTLGYGRVVPDDCSVEEVSVTCGFRFPTAVSLFFSVFRNRFLYGFIVFLAFSTCFDGFIVVGGFNAVRWFYTACIVVRSH